MADLKNAFQQEFVPNGNDDSDIIFDFGVAIRKLKEGERLVRQGWNGKNMWLIYIEADNYELKAWKYFNATEQLPFIAMKTADNKIVPWSASQTDMLASDWQLLK